MCDIVKKTKAGISPPLNPETASQAVVAFGKHYCKRWPNVTIRCYDGMSGRP